MLDIKSKLVLKILLRECPNGSYKIVESKDIISALPSRYKVDNDGLDNILIYLERQECISIKYDDDGLYCLCILPYGNEILENEKKKRENKLFPHFWFIVLVFSLTTLFSCFVGSLVAQILLRHL